VAGARCGVAEWGVGFGFGDRLSFGRIGCGYEGIV
jgi:hypothetical protein